MEEEPKVKPRYFREGTEVFENKKSLSSDAVLGEVPNITDENIQELREIILDSGSSKNYQNKQIREWFVRHFS